MNISIQPDPKLLGVAAGKYAGELIRNTIEIKGRANIILATGTSQFETLNQLIAEPGIDWSIVTMFHLDEYIGIPISHGASFRKYLKERFINKLPALSAVHLINGEADATQECERLSNLIKASSIDVALVGIGENGHLAFNDPPADFDTYEPYIIVKLDEPCRMQQMNEGWFATMADVPTEAISMSIKQIVLSQNIICSVPDLRKAVAVKNTLEKDVSNIYPASILQNHASCFLYLDKDSASLLSVSGK